VMSRAAQEDRASAVCEELADRALAGVHLPAGCLSVHQLEVEVAGVRPENERQVWERNDAAGCARTRAETRARFRARAGSRLDPRSARGHDERGGREGCEEPHPPPTVVSAVPV